MPFSPLHPQLSRTHVDLSRARAFGALIHVWSSPLHPPTAPPCLPSSLFPCPALPCSRPALSPDRLPHPAPLPCPTRPRPAPTPPLSPAPPSPLPHPAPPHPTSQCVGGGALIRTSSRGSSPADSPRIALSIPRQEPLQPLHAGCDAPSAPAQGNIVTRYNGNIHCAKFLKGEAPCGSAVHGSWMEISPAPLP